MEVGSLVKHRIFGIGRVLKILSKDVRVLFGTKNTMVVDEFILKVKAKELKEIDTTNVKRISYVEAKNHVGDLIVGNFIKHYVGIGWITIRVLEDEDLLKYPAYENSLPKPSLTHLNTEGAHIGSNV